MYIATVRSRCTVVAGRWPHLGGSVISTHLSLSALLKLVRAASRLRNDLHPCLNDFASGTHWFELRSFHALRHQSFGTRRPQGYLQAFQLDPTASANRQGCMIETFGIMTESKLRTRDRIESDS
ncbi:uncharacterized protein EI90DRAFT_960090 [Cantharellus anzutake]|uniref:uncharacterized protein n=1 Tax=Cantharellus anzutake TaxID=1750568 RepID=UPI001903085B|nr:uncharacterized protein EI90DRAFT_960090 [Cantharellus anzutake]KAF8331667.1 hypothetical protein EI90DRAFT_960090 [Cantharellus anzutake]